MTRHAIKLPPTFFALLLALVLTLSFAAASGAAETSGIEAFHASRNDAPVWVGGKNDGALNERGLAVLSALAAADRDGLDPSDYAIDPSVTEPGALDRAVSATLIRYVTDLQAGRVAPQKADPDLFVYAREIDISGSLERLAAAEDPKAALSNLAPANPVYRRLRRLLAEYRALEETGGWTNVPGGPALKPGMRDPRVEAVRTRLQATADIGESEGDRQLYDAALEIAVRAFQRRHGLEPDGVVGAKSVAAMNVPVGERIRQILINMERFRWMPDEFGDDHVFVNMAGFELDYVRHGTIDLRMRVVVGRQYRETPVFSDRIRYIEVNPTWTVPPKIANQDLLPKILKDPGFLKTGGFEVFSSWQEDATLLDPAKIDWAKLPNGRVPYRLRQAPGKTNALGQFKFMFPNRFDIYLHDTPARQDFRRAVRAFSSGCIRLEQPQTLAEVLLAADGQPAERLAGALASGKTTRINFKTPVPVHLTYLTTWIGEGGTVEFRDDIYGRDKLLAAALGL
ncbi:MAG: L,D-transpeptidase family protein [Nisaea sp.]|uniref:L,D-transpeptidase family protein n=1 Tax=Nisaea sp. TaxID=2024842 RepID=UPI001B1F436A|nr:L,D-transpeptidase family protein [Nisaea sp.]MBO6562752.1 L,D-transpeptidase family protein [Nisaea sp.]